MFCRLFGREPEGQIGQLKYKNREAITKKNGSGKLYQQLRPNGGRSSVFAPRPPGVGRSLNSGRGLPRRRVCDVYAECKSAVAQQGVSSVCMHPWQHVPGHEGRPVPSRADLHAAQEAAGGCRPVAWGGPSPTTARRLMSFL